MRKIIIICFLLISAGREIEAKDLLQNLKQGNEYIFSSINMVTNKAISNTTITINDASPSEYLIRWGDGLHVYNNDLRSIKRSSWTYNPYGCDGLPKELKEGFIETYKYSGTWERDKDKSDIIGTCIIRVGGEKEVSINDKKFRVVHIENVRTYHFKRNPNVKRLFIQDAYFSTDLGMWVEGDWIEKHNNRLFSHTRFQLQQYSLR